MPENKDKKVLVCGVFDGLHEGHIYFLNEAKKHGNHLTIALTPDQMVMSLKQHLPRYRFQERKDALLKTNIPDSVILGDTTIGAWNVLTEVSPLVIACGYDQESLFETLTDMQLKNKTDWQLVRIHDHRGEELHSSILSKHENS